MTGPGTWCHGQVGKAEISQRLDSVFFEIFSNLNDFVILSLQAAFLPQTGQPWPGMGNGGEGHSSLWADTNWTLGMH